LSGGRRGGVAITSGSPTSVTRMVIAAAYSPKGRALTETSQAHSPLSSQNSAIHRVAVCLPRRMPSFREDTFLWRRKSLGNNMPRLPLPSSRSTFSKQSGMRFGQALRRGRQMAIATKKQNDSASEIEAIGVVHTALKGLDALAQMRVLRYVAEMLALSFAPGVSAEKRRRARRDAIIGFHATAAGNWVRGGY
jgi:hypothetical protein